MIKKYRNALLAAAVASVAVGCGGGDGGGGTSPLEDENLVNNIINTDPITHRALAQLLGGAFYQLITTTSDVFKSVDVVADSNSTMGKIISPAVSTNSAKPTAGIAKTANVPCAENGSFDSSINIEGVDDTAELSGIEVLSEKALDANIRFTYRECDEPAHESYTDNGDAAETNDPVFETDEDGNVVHNLLDGIFSVTLRTSVGSPTNADDYSVSAFIEMKDYFIQRYSEGSTPERPDVLNGEVDLSLITEDGSDYLISLSTNLSNNNNSTGKGFVKTAFLADGQVTLTDEFAFEAYDLSINGTMRDLVVGGDSDYQIYSTQNLIGAGSDTNLLGLLPQPSQGQLAITTRDGDTSIATVTDDGLSIESVINGVVETSTCTWDQISENDC